MGHARTVIGLEHHHILPQNEENKAAHGRDDGSDNAKKKFIAASTSHKVKKRLKGLQWATERPT